MFFEPYVPPNEGAGILTVDRDLCWRINERGLVTTAVIGAVCWTRNNFRMSDAQQLADFHWPWAGVPKAARRRHRAASQRCSSPCNP